MTRDRDSRKLEAVGTQLLRRAGCNAAGRKLGEVDYAQLQFERRLIKTPTGGQCRKRCPLPTKPGQVISPHTNFFSEESNAGS